MAIIEMERREYLEMFAFVQERQAIFHMLFIWFSNDSLWLTMATFGFVLSNAVYLYCHYFEPKPKQNQQKNEGACEQEVGSQGNHKGGCGSANHVGGVKKAQDKEAEESKKPHAVSPSNGEQVKKVYQEIQKGATADLKEVEKAEEKLETLKIGEDADIQKREGPPADLEEVEKSNVKNVDEEIQKAPTDLKEVEKAKEQLETLKIQEEEEDIEKKESAPADLKEVEKSKDESSQENENKKSKYFALLDMLEEKFDRWKIEFNQVEIEKKELEKARDKVEEDYKKMLKKKENIWDKKLKLAHAKFEDDRYKWDEARDQVEEYYKKMLKKKKHIWDKKLKLANAKFEEDRHKWEEEKNNLSAKLCAATALSEIYRDFLRNSEEIYGCNASFDNCNI